MCCYILAIIRVKEVRYPKYKYILHVMWDNTLLLTPLPQWSPEDSYLIHKLVLLYCSFTFEFIRFYMDFIHSSAATYKKSISAITNGYTRVTSRYKQGHNRLHT